MCARSQEKLRCFMVNDTVSFSSFFHVEQEPITYKSKIFIDIYRRVFSDRHIFKIRFRPVNSVFAGS